MKELISVMQEAFLLYFSPCRAPKCWGALSQPNKTSLVKLKHSKNKFESAAATQALKYYSIYEDSL